MTRDEAVYKIIGIVEKLKKEETLDEDILKLNAESYVQTVLDYCHRQDFPEALCVTIADCIARKITQLSNEDNTNNIKSISMDDTKIEYNTYSPIIAGDEINQDIKNLGKRLNIYRKVQGVCVYRLK